MMQQYNSDISGKSECNNMERIPFTERMEFQEVLMEEVGFIRGKKHEEAEKWAINNAEKIADIIDNKNNEEIRSLIMNGDYKEASKYVLKELEKSGQKELVYH